MTTGIKHILTSLIVLTIGCFSMMGQTKIVRTEAGCGVKDLQTSQWIIPAVFNRITEVDDVSSSDYCYACMLNGKYALYTNTGKRFTHFAFDDVRTKKDKDLLIVEQNGMWGVINAQGIIIYPFKYKVILPHKSGELSLTLPNETIASNISSLQLLATRKISEKRGVKYEYDEELEADAVKRIMMPQQSEEVRYSNIAETQATKHFKVSSISGLIMSPFENGCFVVSESKTGKGYIYDISGNNIGHFKTDHPTAIAFDEDGVALTYLSDYNLAIIGTDGCVKKELGHVSAYSAFMDGIAVICENGTSSRINTNGEKVEGADTKYNPTDALLTGLYPTSNWPLSENRRVFYSKGKYGFLDANGVVVIPARFTQVHNFNDGLAAVAVKDGNLTLWGFIDDKGDFAIDPKFSVEPGDFFDGYALVTKKDGTECYVNPKGEICSGDYKDGSNFHNGIAFIQDKDGRILQIDKGFNVIQQSTFKKWKCKDYGSYLCDNNYIYNDNGERLLKLGTFSSLGPISDEGITYIKQHNGGKTGYFNVSTGEWIIILEESEF